MSVTKSRILTFTRRTLMVLLNIVAVVGLLVVTALIVLNSVGAVRVTTMSSDAMSPSIPNGSVLFSVPATGNVTVGDVAVLPAAGNTSTVGRVVSATGEGGEVTAYVLKSDNRVLPDEWAYKVSPASVNRLMFSLPLLGFLFTAVGGTVSAVAFAGLVLLFGLVWFFGFHSPRRRRIASDGFEETLGEVSSAPKFITIPVEGGWFARTRIRWRNHRSARKAAVSRNGADILQAVFVGLGEPVNTVVKHPFRERRRLRREENIRIPVRGVKTTVPGDVYAEDEVVVNDGEVR